MQSRLGRSSNEARMARISLDAAGHFLFDPFSPPVLFVQWWRSR